MHQFSKSKLMAYRQCPKRLWLELHRPELRDDSGSQAAFASGNSVGEVARKVFAPSGQGINIDPNLIGWDTAAEQTDALLQSGDWIVFEALLRIPGALALADVMRPDSINGELKWELIEVKGSASLKNYHRDDVAIQTFIADQAGIPLSKSCLAHIDKSFVYQGGENYTGLFQVVDLTEEARNRSHEVASWLAETQQIAAMKKAPEIAVGPQCAQPYLCSFCSHCHADIPKNPPDPFRMLPGLRSSRRNAWSQAGIDSLESTPDRELSGKQTLVKVAHLTGETFFDAVGARQQIEAHGPTPYFLDFETVMFAVPTWIGTRPYQNVPFQYSVHHLNAGGTLEHREFLELDGRDPRRRLCEQLIQDCGELGPIFVFRASFERMVIMGLAESFPELAPDLTKILDRIVDLHPIAKNSYYHPSQNGKWSLKAIAPAIAPDISYTTLEGVQNGMEAGPAYLEAISPGTTPDRKETLRQQMLAYCKLDTLATVRIWEYFRDAKK
jgi:hypothetical protein